MSAAISPTATTIPAPPDAPADRARRVDLAILGVRLGKLGFQQACDGCIEAAHAGTAEEAEREARHGLLVASTMHMGMAAAIVRLVGEIDEHAVVVLRKYRNECADAMASAERALAEVGAEVRAADAAQKATGGTGS